MLQWTLHVDKTSTSAKQFVRSLPGRMRPAVRNIAKVFLERIIDKTPAPPTPPGQHYIRTGRLRSGWRGAANELGVGIPIVVMPPQRMGYYGASPRESDLPGVDFQEVVTQSEVSFLMRNRVPYAFFVEVAGPGFSPRGGVFMVMQSSAETEPDFVREVQAAWMGEP